MARKTTIISTVTDASGGGGMLVLGAMGVAAGILAVDHHYSRRGHSAWDKLKRSVSGGVRTAGDFAGAAVAIPWAEMKTAKISPAFQQYIRQVVEKALTSEDAQTLQQLAVNLAAAGLHQIADAVQRAGAAK